MPKEKYSLRGIFFVDLFNEKAENTYKSLEYKLIDRAGGEATEITNLRVNNHFTLDNTIPTHWTLALSNNQFPLPNTRRVLLQYEDSYETNIPIGRYVYRLDKKWTYPYFAQKFIETLDPNFLTICQYSKGTSLELAFSIPNLEGDKPNKTT